MMCRKLHFLINLVTVNFDVLPFYPKSSLTMFVGGTMIKILLIIINTFLFYYLIAYLVFNKYNQEHIEH